MADQVDGLALVAGLRGEGDGDRPGAAVRQPHPLDDGLPGLAALEAVERREAAVRQELEVGGLASAQPQLAHAATRTRESRYASTLAADSSIVSASVSIVISGSSGGS